MYSLGGAKVFGPLPQRRITVRPDGRLVDRHGRGLDPSYVVAPVGEVGGDPDDPVVLRNYADRVAKELNRRRFYAHLYLGLYYESLGDPQRALRHLTSATEHRIGHYMWDVARVARNTLSTKK